MTGRKTRKKKRKQPDEARTDRAVRPVRVGKGTKVLDFVEQLKFTSFQSRNVYKTFNVMEAMVSDPDRPTVFLGLAGAMVPAGMKRALTDMIEYNMVDVIVSTGANLAHDIVESLGYPHIMGNPRMDDAELRRTDYCRIYDTYVSDKGFDATEALLMSIFSGMEPRVYSSRELFEIIGEKLDPEESLIGSAFRLGVPIYCPALCDSEIGIALTRHHVLNLNEPKPIIDPIRDNYELYQIYEKSRKTGAIFIGGGVPRNYIQQLGVMCEVFGTGRADLDPELGHSYGILITTDDPKHGGLSGCTFSESITWGKYSVEAKTATVYADATIILPLLVGAIIQKLEHELTSKSRIEFLWKQEVLKAISYRS